MNRPIGMIRISAGFLPRRPVQCPQRCVYNIDGVCDDPRTNRGNSDASCHKKSVAKLLDSLSEIGEQAAQAMLPGKVERHCPRCGHHSNHWLIANGSESALKNTKRHTARCTDCGHQWPCRVMAKDL